MINFNSGSTRFVKDYYNSVIRALPHAFSNTCAQTCSLTCLYPPRFISVLSYDELFWTNYKNIHPCFYFPNSVFNWLVRRMVTSQLVNNFVLKHADSLTCSYLFLDAIYMTILLGIKNVLLEIPSFSEQIIWISHVPLNVVTLFYIVV